MLLRDLSQWTNLEETRGLLYLVQRLEELTFPYSLDSYKSPTMSAQSLIDEAIEIATNAQNVGEHNFEKYINSLVHVTNEIKLRLKGNFIAKSISTLNLDELIGNPREGEKIAEVIRRLELARAELNNQEYFHEIVAAIISNAQDAKKKKKIDFLAREFVSFLQLRGVSRDHIQTTLIDFFWSGNNISTVSQFTDFCRSVYPHEHKFTLVFGVSRILSSLDARTLMRSGIMSLPGEVDWSDFEDLSKEFVAAIDDFRTKGELPDLCMVFCEATDYSSAVTAAKTSIEEAFNFFRIFNHKQEIQISSIAVVEQHCCQGTCKTVPAPSNSMRFIRDMRKVQASSVMKRYSDNIMLDVGPDEHKFQNIVNIHGISLNVSSVDVQLVNIWTCLETIVPSDNTTSKISNVVERSIPMLMLGYYNRIVVNLLFDILRWNRPAFKKCLSMIKDAENDDLKTKFINLLADPTHDAALSFLLGECANFELLKNRIFSVSKLLADNGKALEKLEAHETMVRWQIHRIYRTRNSIVHSGQSPEYNRYLVENAHDFFDQIFLFCLELSAWKRGFRTFLSCFDYAETQYRSYHASLKAGNIKNVVWQLPRYRDKSIVFGDQE